MDEDKDGHGDEEEEEEEEKQEDENQFRFAKGYPINHEEVQSPLRFTCSKLSSKRLNNMSYDQSPCRKAVET